MKGLIAELTRQVSQLSDLEKVRSFLYSKNFHDRLFRRVRKLFFSNYFFISSYNLSNKILVAGLGRSGTTWLAELIANYFQYRIISEPFRHIKLSKYKELLDRPFIPPNKTEKIVFKVYEYIISGKMNIPIVNLNNFYFKPKGAVIKGITINLALKWIRNNFPKIPIIFIIRHPCAFTSSRIKFGNPIDQRFNQLLKKEYLIENYFHDKKEFIYNCKSEIEKLTVLWCVENFIPLKFMKKEDWIITTYEDLNLNLVAEMKRIVNYIDPTKKFDTKKIKNLTSSSTSIKKTKDTQIFRISKWKTDLSENQIKRIIEIVKLFSMDKIYSRDIRPNHNFGQF